MKFQVGDIFYRYEDVQYAPPLDECDYPIGEGRLVIQLQKLSVIKVTPKGVRLVNDKLIITTATKQYACATIELALASFKARKQCQIRIYEARLMRAKRALAMASGECEPLITLDRTVNTALP